MPDIGDESPKDTGSHAQKLPTLRVNSNDLSWLKEQKGSKDSQLFQGELSGDVVRLSTHAKKVSQFYIPPVVSTEEGTPIPEDMEDVKASSPVPSFETIPTPANTISPFILYCECGNPCEGENSLCDKCLEKQKPIEFSGHLYAHVYSGINLCWFRLLNKELYCT